MRLLEPHTLKCRKVSDQCGTQTCDAQLEYLAISKPKVMNQSYHITIALYLDGHHIV